MIKRDKLKDLFMLFSLVKDNVTHHIAMKMDPADSWHTLHELYESKNTIKLVYLFDQLHALWLKES